MPLFICKLHHILLSLSLPSRLLARVKKIIKNNQQITIKATKVQPRTLSRGACETLSNRMLLQSRPPRDTSEPRTNAPESRVENLGLNTLSRGTVCPNRLRARTCPLILRTSPNCPSPINPYINHAPTAPPPDFPPTRVFNRLTRPCTPVDPRSPP